MSSLGFRIRAARENVNLSQSDLAGKVGARSKAVISQWESDVSRPDVDKLVAVAYALAVPVSYLLDCHVGEDAPNLLPHERRLIEAYRGLDETGRARVGAYLAEQADRCKAAVQKSTQVIDIQPDDLFLPEGDEQYETMRLSASVLEQMRGLSHKAYSEIAEHLWSLGLAGAISASDVEDIFRKKKVPSPALYMVIVAYLQFYISLR